MIKSEIPASLLIFSWSFQKQMFLIFKNNFQKSVPAPTVVAPPEGSRESAPPRVGPVQLSFVSAGPVQVSFVSAGPVQVSFVSAGPVQLTFVSAGPVQLTLDSAGPV